MRTLRQRLEDALHNRGLYREEAVDCITAWDTKSQVASVLKTYRSNYLEEENDAVPDGLVWMSVRAFALKWLREKYPHHWAIGVFEEECK